MKKALVGIETTERVTALTFDDGPGAWSTHRVLDVLQENNVKATFFVVAERVEACRGVFSRIIDDGHEVGHHGMTHTPGFWDMLPRCPHYDANLYRPPYGHLTWAAWAGCRAMNMKPVGWNYHASDWLVTDSHALEVYLRAHMRHGGIGLLHDNHPSDREGMIRALDRVLYKMSCETWEFMTVGQLLKRGKPIWRRW